MSLNDQISTDNAMFVSPEDFGHSAVFTLHDWSDTVECDVLIDFDVILQPSSYDAQVVETGITVTALYDDVGEPRKGSIFVINSITYTVARITDNDMVFVVTHVVEES